LVFFCWLEGDMTYFGQLGRSYELTTLNVKLIAVSNYLAFIRDR
jgi:hypothetical protein